MSRSHFAKRLMFVSNKALANWQIFTAAAKSDKVELTPEEHFSYIGQNMGFTKCPRLSDCALIYNKFLIKS